MSQNISRPEKILKKYFLRKQKSNTKFSLRALAKSLSLQPSYISEIMAGKKPFPIKRLNQFSKILEMDDFATQSLKESTMTHHMKLPVIKNSNNNILMTKCEEEFLPVETLQYKILDRWYYLAIADLCTCETFCNDPKWIAKKLKISLAEVIQALDYLLETGVLVKENNIFKKMNTKLRFPNKRAHPSIIQFHKEIIKKSFEDLNNLDQNKFDDKFFNSLTLAVNIEKLDEVKQILKEAIHRAALVAAEGPCQEVYGLHVSFFPLTKT